MILSKHSKISESIIVSKFFLLSSSDTPEILFAKCFAISFSRIFSISKLGISLHFSFSSFFSIKLYIVLSPVLNISSVLLFEPENLKN